MITRFTDLLQQATEQPNAQRLLFLFAESQVTKKSNKREQKKGTLTPVMCVDKLPQDLTSFQALVAEADTMSKDWNMVFIAGLNGDGDVPPTTDEAGPYLNQMTNNLASGQDLSGYLVFDRAENLIVIEAAGTG